MCVNSFNKLNNAYNIFIKFPIFFSFHFQTKPDNGHCLFREDLGINSQFEFKLADNSSIQLEIVIPKTNTSKRSNCAIFNKIKTNSTATSIKECIKFDPNKKNRRKNNNPNTAMSFATTPSPLLQSRPQRQQLSPLSTLSSLQNYNRNIVRKSNNGEKGKNAYKNSYNANEISFNSEKSVAPEDRSTSMPDSEFYSVASQQQLPHQRHHPSQHHLQQQQQPPPYPHMRHSHQKRRPVNKRGQNRYNNSVGR